MANPHHEDQDLARGKRAPNSKKIKYKTSPPFFCFLNFRAASPQASNGLSGVGRRLASRIFMDIFRDR
jgi:hypothetical protein